jgi:hypothetical protein
MPIANEFSAGLKKAAKELGQSDLLVQKLENWLNQLSDGKSGLDNDTEIAKQFDVLLEHVHPATPKED